MFSKILLFLLFVYCIDSYQKSLPEKPKINDVCTDCKWTIGELDKVLKNPKMKQLKEMLKKVCDELPTASECRLLIDRFFILNDPKKACKTLHFCSKNSLINYAKLLKKQLKKWQRKAKLRNDGFVCNQCLWIAGQLHNVLNDEHFQAQVLDVIEESICSHLGEAEEECNRLADQFIQIFFNLISKQFADSKAFCTQIHLCLNRKNADQTSHEKGFPFVKPVFVR